MSKISTIYDYFTTELATLFSAKTRIPNPFSMVDNNHHFLRDGYGLKTEGHGLTSNQPHYLVQEYAFNIILSREVLRLDSDPTPIDTAIKAIEEDTLTARDYFYDIDCVGIPDAIERVNLGSTGPISFINTGQNNFIFIETTILVTIREQFQNC